MLLPVEMWSIDRLQPYARNPRNDAGVDEVAASIQQFGFRQNIVVDGAGVIVIGHKRWLAAKKLGMKAVPVNVARELTEAQAAALRIADNQKRSEWDIDLLRGELEALRTGGFDIGGLGWSSTELQRMLGAKRKPAAEIDAATVAPAPAKPLTRPGDLITLGRHRLICADAQEPAAWNRLVGTARAAALFTDPPYGIGYVGKAQQDQEGRQRAGLRIVNDDLPPDALAALLRAALTLAAAHVVPGGAWFVCGPHGPAFYPFAQVCTELGVWRQTLCWVKDRYVLSRQDFHWQQEVILAGFVPPDGAPGGMDQEEAEEFTPIAYGWVPDAAHTWLGDRRASTVLRYPRPASARQHPTMKPVALIEDLLKVTVPPGALVVDCFAGSGSTLLACEGTDHTAALLELDPAYCDVIVTRWEALTGEKAVRSKRPIAKARQSATPARTKSRR